MTVLDRFFFIWGTKKMVSGRVRQVAVFIVTIVWELACAHAALVIFDKWTSYRGGPIIRFDCSIFYK